MNEQIEALCRQAITDRVFPGCSLGYVRNGEATTQTVGNLTYEPSSPAVTVATRYDVASVTKSVPTSTLLLKAVQDGRVGLDDQVIRYVPELDNAYREQVLIRHLLTYTVIFDLPGGLSGLARRDPALLLKNLLTSPLQAPPGERYFYTNGPAIVMGLVVERVYGLRLDEVAHREFFGPLGMKHSTFGTGNLRDDLVAPSEIVDGKEVRGVVHDESARIMAAANNVSGAAGLFTTAEDLLKFAQMLLAQGSWDGVTIVNPATIESMHTNQLAGLGLTAGLGWEMGRPEIMGRAENTNAFMKSGFTGCLMVVDPKRSMALVHLSNRTYPKRPEREPIWRFWRELNELFFL